MRVAGAGAATNWLLDRRRKEPSHARQPDALEMNMITSTFDDNEILPLPLPGGRSAAALRYLMRVWERDGAVDEGESESELMVLLSGMVSVSDATSDA